MRVDIPCTLSIVIDLDEFSAAVAVEMAKKVVASARGASLTSVNTTRAKDFRARVDEARGLIQDHVRKTALNFTDIRLSLSHLSRNAVTKAFHELRSGGAIVPDASGRYSLRKAEAEAEADPT